MNNSIILKNIIKDYKSGDDYIRVLHGISLEINSKNLTMLVGPSGCGKTTLLSIITGILKPTEGEVIANNNNLTKLSDRKKVLFRRNNMGFIFQQFNLLPSLTAAENAAIPLVAAGMSMNKASDIATEILARINMQDHVHKLPSHLSGGQQQRVAIARALVHDPKIIVCDEPTAALDAKTGHTVLEILKQASMEHDRIVIIVTHDNRIFEFADRIIYMNDGKIEQDEVR